MDGNTSYLYDLKTIVLPKSITPARVEENFKGSYDVH